MKKKLYILRHGETELNRLGIYQGTLDSSLTAYGREQVRQNALLLKQKLYNVEDQTIVFFVSPLGRTKQSAKIITDMLNQKQITSIEEELLKEVTIGSWNGKNKQEIQKDNPELYYDEYKWYFMSIDGESYDDVVFRCEEWLKKLKNLDQEHIIVMTHGLFGRVLRGCLLNLSYEETVKLDVSQSGFYIIEGTSIEFVTNDFEYD